MDTPGRNRINGPLHGPYEEPVGTLVVKDAATEVVFSTGCEQPQIDAAHEIIVAVNAHDDLIDAMRQLRSRLEDHLSSVLDPEDMSANRQQMIAIVDAALKKAGAP